MEPDRTKGAFTLVCNARDTEPLEVFKVLEVFEGYIPSPLRLVLTISFIDAPAHCIPPPELPPEEVSPELLLCPYFTTAVVTALPV
jgi:hypothetical protein